MRETIFHVTIQCESTKLVCKIHNHKKCKIHTIINPLVPMRGIFGIFECPFDMLSGIAQNEKRSWSR